MTRLLRKEHGVQDNTASIMQRSLRIYLSQMRRVWSRLPSAMRDGPLGHAYGRHVHHVVRLSARRTQAVATWFLRNRPELELLGYLLKDCEHAPAMAVLACSKGAEVYSIVWSIRSMLPRLRLSVSAVDISHEILDFAARGEYSLEHPTASMSLRENANDDQLALKTLQDQGSSIFERLTSTELDAMCEVKGSRATIRPELKEGIRWLHGDAFDPHLVDLLGPQDVVIANRFLCHMAPASATKCLFNIARLVKPGGYLFVSGVDLEVRARVARALKWKPVTRLIREIHDGDPTLRWGWPLEYWGLEPFSQRRPDWQLRYTSVFQIGCT